MAALATEKLFSGVYPAIVSPVTADGTVMEPQLRALVRRFLATPVQGIYVGGGTGEGILLPVQVRKRVAEIVVDEVRKAAPESFTVIIHVGAAEYLNVVELARHATEIGADALSAIPPLYFAYTREQVIAYYTALASLTELPFIIYASAQAGIPFTADMLKELAQLPTIRGIKFTGYNFFELMRMRDAVPNDFSILNGGDEVLQFGFMAGSDGGVGAIYNIMPTRFHMMHAAWKREDLAALKNLQLQVNAIIEIIIRFPVIATVKAMLGLLGYPVGETVFPNNPITSEGITALEQALEEFSWTEPDGSVLGWRDICV